MSATAPRVLSLAGHYAADCRDESAELAAAERPPKARMAAPTVPNGDDPLFITSDTKRGLSSQGTITGKLDVR